MTTILNVAEWIDRGANPDDEHAPPLEVLDALERDDQLVRVESFGGKLPTCVLSTRGRYEADRIFAVRYRVDGEPDDSEVTSTSDDRKLGAAFRRLWLEWDDDKDDNGTLSGSAADLCSDVFAVFTSNGLAIR